jgi:DNA primase
MPKYPRDLIDRIDKATDLVKLVRQHVDLKPSGQSWVGLCPFHAEKTPSFHVHPERGYYCFGCHEGGRAFQFVMKMGGMSFPDAVKDLAGRAGIPLPEPAWEPAERRDRTPKAVLYELMEKAAAWYEAQLWEPSGRAALRYLIDGRGLSREVVTEFRLGLAPDRWEALRAHLAAKRHSDKAMAAAGLIKARAGGGGFYDVFRHRLMIPVSDLDGRVVAMAGRVWEPASDERAAREAKYVNSPTTDIYEKGRLLYGLRQARPHVKAGGLVFLVEGYFDLISLVSYGVKPVAAVMGTALTAQQLSALRSLAKEVHLVFDSDEAGERATKRALPLLYNAGLDGRVIRLPDGHDPDSFVREFGGRAFYELADQAPDIADYFVSRLEAVAGGTLTGASRMVGEAQQVLAQVPDGAQRQYLALQLAKKLGLSPELLSGGRGSGPQPGAYPGAYSGPRPGFGGGSSLGPAGGPVPGAGPRASGAAGDGGAPWTQLAEALLTHAIIHPECLPVLEPLCGQWPDDRLRRVLSALRAGAADCDPQAGGARDGGPPAGADPAWAVVPERLRFDDDDRLASLVSGALLSPRRMRAQDSVPAARELAGRLQGLWNRRAVAELAKAVKAAEDSKDQILVNRLLSSRPSQ